MVNDPLPFIRTQVVGHLYTLLADKPEQEHNLLILLSNKLVCSFADHSKLRLISL